MPLVFDPAVSLLGIYPADIAPTIRGAHVYSSQHWKQLKCPYREDTGESTLGHPHTVENNVTVKKKGDGFY